MDPWKAALAGTVPVLMLFLLGISYTGWKKHQAKEREVKKKQRESRERYQMENEKERALKAKGIVTPGQIGFMEKLGVQVV